MNVSPRVRCRRDERVSAPIRPPRRRRSRVSQLDISREEQRVLHALAQGGTIVALKDDHDRITGIECFNRDGWLMPQVALLHFKKLKRKKAIASADGRPYRITRRGLELVRAEGDNR